MEVKLIVVGGATENDEFQIRLPAVFGRARDSAIPLPHPLISRQHCELFERHGQLLVRDLGSTNGTFVGSERIVESELRNGELLTIGTVTLRASIGQSLDEHQPVPCLPNNEKVTAGEADGSSPTPDAGRNKSSEKNDATDLQPLTSAQIARRASQHATAQPIPKSTTLAPELATEQHPQEISSQDTSNLSQSDTGEIAGRVLD